MTEQVTPQQVMARLDTLAFELNQKSSWLHEVERDLEPVDIEYHKLVDAFELGLLLRSEDPDQNYKLPSEALRIKLARSEMDPELLGSYEGLVRKRKRLERRLKDIGTEIDAQRSLLSALKELASV